MYPTCVSIADDNKCIRQPICIKLRSVDHIATDGFRHAETFQPPQAPSNAAGGGGGATTRERRGFFHEILI